MSVVVIDRELILFVDVESSDDSKSVGHGESDDEYAAFLDRDKPNDDGIQASRGISEVSVISSITAASQ